MTCPRFVLIVSLVRIPYAQAPVEELGIDDPDWQTPRAGSGSSKRKTGLRSARSPDAKGEDDASKAHGQQPFTMMHASKLL